MSNTTDQLLSPPTNSAPTPANTAPTPTNTTPPTESKSRKRSGDNWLPPGWTMEVRARTSGTKAGIVDKFYYEPVTARKFRSKSEVMYYLEHGSPRKKVAKKSEDWHLVSQDSEGRRSNKKQTKSMKKANEQLEKPLKFDFLNVPDKVIWTGAHGSQEAWWPFIGEYKVQESESKDWDRAFALITSLRHDGKTAF